MRLAIWPVASARVLGRVLADAIRQLGGDLELMEVEPFEARKALVGKHVDLALIPSLDLLRDAEGLEILPGPALVGEASPTRQLVVSVPLDQITTVGFDPRYAQEALLAQLVLREHYGVEPVFRLVEPGTPLTDALAAHGTLLASVAEPVPEGAVPLDLAREWTDLTLRPFVWGLLAIREDGVSADTARQLGEAVRTAGPLDALFVDGVAAFQLTLDGYAIDGLDEFTEHLFATGTLSEIPGLPFIELVSKKGGLAEDEER
ncbi:MAG: MqnA/MqnD/SBP family protein [Bacteroidota bacterium]